MIGSKGFNDSHFNWFIKCYVTKFTSGTKRHGKEDTSKSFSIEILVGVAVGCICSTAVVIFTAIFVLRKFLSGHVGKLMQNKITLVLNVQVTLSDILHFTWREL